MLRIGIDLDNTITELPEFFALLARALRAAGHQVHIVSYRDAKDLDKSRAEVRDLGVEFDEVHHPRGSEGIPEFKARMARELKLDMLIDDMPEALINLPGHTKRMWLCDPEVYDLGAVIRSLGTQILKF